MAKIKLETKMLNKKPPEIHVLDLWHVKIQTKEEFKNIFEKIPNYKVHEDLVSRRSNIKINILKNIKMYIVGQFIIR